MNTTSAFLCPHWARLTSVYSMRGREKPPLGSHQVESSGTAFLLGLSSWQQAPEPGSRR